MLFLPIHWAPGKNKVVWGSLSLESEPSRKNGKPLLHSSTLYQIITPVIYDLFTHPCLLSVSTNSLKVQFQALSSLCRHHKSQCLLLTCFLLCSLPYCDLNERECTELKLCNIWLLTFLRENGSSAILSWIEIMCYELMTLIIFSQLL